MNKDLLKLHRKFCNGCREYCEPKYKKILKGNNQEKKTEDSYEDYEKDYRSYFRQVMEKYESKGARRKRERHTPSREEVASHRASSKPMPETKKLEITGKGIFWTFVLGVLGVVMYFGFFSEADAEEPLLEPKTLNDQPMPATDPTKKRVVNYIELKNPEEQGAFEPSNKNCQELHKSKDKNDPRFMACLNAEKQFFKDEIERKRRAQEHEKRFYEQEERRTQLIREQEEKKRSELNLESGYKELNFSCSSEEHLLLNFNGETLRMIDGRNCVDSSIFEKDVAEIYGTYSDDAKFLQDLQLSMSNLITYKGDPAGTDVPQHPVTTLQLETGDCEDTSILMASMLKAVPKDWKIDYILMDADNPEDPQDINHVIIGVDIGDSYYFIETTDSIGVGRYPYVNGWYFRI